MFKKLFLLAGLLLYTAPAYPVEPVKFNNVTVLVNSCDKYSDLWEPFHHFLFEKWPSLKTYNKHVPILLISNAKTYAHPRVTSVKIPNETSWSDTILQALERVETDYVLILLEDYIITAPVNEKRLQELFLGMQHSKAAYLQVSGDHAHGVTHWHPSIPGVRFAGKHEQWRTSLQACIWHKADLKWILKRGEGIWNFEIAGSFRSEGMPKPFLKTTQDHPILYHNAAQGGYLNASVMRWIHKNGGVINATGLPIDENHTIKLTLKRYQSYFYWHVYLPTEKFLRSIF